MSQLDYGTDKPLWDASAVARLMTSKDIPHRAALARAIGYPQSSVYDAFDESWGGEVNGPLLVAICRGLNVPPAKLLRDPRH
jgi:hypothetical protein